MIVNKTRSILQANNFYPKKKFGQNFLINPTILDTILKNSVLDKNKGVIEIGPGLGALTEVLALNSKKVLCYEIDNNIVDILSRNLRKHNNVIIENKDFLKVDLNEDIAKYMQDTNEIVVIANLPYNITTPILFKLLQQEGLNKFILMVQKEVGSRLTGKPNTKDYNALSVLMAYKTKSKLISLISPNSFYPEPKVESALLTIEVIEPDYKVNNEGKLLKFIRAIFSQKRKTLVNNINSNYDMNKEEIKNILIKLNFKENIRAEGLDIEQIVELYKNIFG